MIAYTVVLSILLTVLGILIAIRTSVETTLMRVPGQLFQEKMEKSRTCTMLKWLINQMILKY